MIVMTGVCDDACLLYFVNCSLYAVIRMRTADVCLLCFVVCTLATLSEKLVSHWFHKGSPLTMIFGIDCQVWSSTEMPFL